jgi:hypothetical protein
MATTINIVGVALLRSSTSGGSVLSLLRPSPNTVGLVAGGLGAAGLMGVDRSDRKLIKHLTAYLYPPRKLYIG